MGKSSETGSPRRNKLRPGEVGGALHGAGIPPQYDSALRGRQGRQGRQDGQDTGPCLSRRKGEAKKIPKIR